MLHGYMEIITFTIPNLNQQQKQYAYFRQDGTTAHTAGIVMEVLQDYVFPNQLISSFRDIPWPVKSSDSPRYILYLIHLMYYILFIKLKITLNNVINNFEGYIKLSLSGCPSVYFHMK